MGDGAPCAAPWGVPSVRAMTTNLRGRTVRSVLTCAMALTSLALAGCDSAPEAHPLGTKVDVRFYSLLEGTEQGPGTVAVTDVRVGERGDLEAAGFELDADQADATPYYVDVTFTNTGKVPVDLRDPSGIDQHDDLVPSLTVLDLGGSSVFAECPLLPDTLAPGGSVDGCAIVLAPDGVDLDRISYLPDTTEDFVYWASGV